jgi:hypothetical protein
MIVMKAYRDFPERVEEFHILVIRHGLVEETRRRFIACLFLPSFEIPVIDERDVLVTKPMLSF